jgi:hypothetical protein
MLLLLRTLVGITNSNKLESIQRKFADLFQDMEYHYDNLLERLHLHYIFHNFDGLFLINVFNGTKCCPSALETVGLRARI